MLRSAGTMPQPRDIRAVDLVKRILSKSRAGRGGGGGGSAGGSVVGGGSAASHPGVQVAPQQEQQELEQQPSGLVGAVQQFQGKHHAPGAPPQPATEGGRASSAAPSSGAVPGASEPAAGSTASGRPAAPSRGTAPGLANFLAALRARAAAKAMTVAADQASGPGA